MSFWLYFALLFIIFMIIQIVNQQTIDKLFKQGDYEKLENRFKKMLSGAMSNSTIAYAYQNLIIIYMETNRYNEAHECINKVKELGFSNSVILGLNESALLVKESRFDEAEAVINNCLKYKHLNKQYKVLLLNNLVNVMINTNRVSEAKNMLDDLLKEYPTNTSLLATLGDFYMAQNDFSSAKEAYNKSLQYPDNKIHGFSHVQYVKKQLDLINTKLVGQALPDKN